MEIPTSIQALFSQSPALALALFIWYYSNRDILRLLQERRDIIEALRVERKEWLDTLRIMLADYRNDSRASLEAKVAIQAELHALRGKMTDLILKVEMLLMRAGKDDQRSGSDD